MLRRITALALSFGLLFQQIGFAQVAVELNIANYLSRVGSSFSQERFRPPQLRYFSYDSLSDNFKVLLDKGDLKNLQTNEVESSTKTLLNYFLVGVSLPDSMFWVNLRPDSEDQIIDQYLEKTDLGKVMLEADLQLKKDTAAFTSPQTSEGKEYWDKLYKKAAELYGYDAVTIPTLTRPWIVPGEIIVRESSSNPPSAYVYKAGLKVMLEQDYLKNSATYNFKDSRSKELNDYSSQLIRELIIPKLTREVNSSKRYAALRQVYYSLILSRWFKLRFTGQTGTYASLINSRNLTNLTSNTSWSKTDYFNLYKKSFAEGEYNIKEPVYTPTGQVIRSYFSGGVKMDILPNIYSAPEAPKVFNQANVAVETFNAAGLSKATSVNSPVTTGQIIAQLDTLSESVKKTDLRSFADTALRIALQLKGIAGMQVEAPNLQEIALAAIDNLDKWHSPEAFPNTVGYIDLMERKMQTIKGMLEKKPLTVGSPITAGSAITANKNFELLHQIPEAVKALADRDLTGKNVLIRVNVNVKSKDGDIVDPTRLLETREIVNLVLDRGGTPILFGHNGRLDTKKAKDDRQSLKDVSVFLQNYVFPTKKVIFHEGSIIKDGGKGLQLKKSDIVKGAVNLLEGVRFADEYEVGPKRMVFARSLINLSDGIFIFDAFGDIGSKGASVQTVPFLAKEVYLGPAMVREFGILENIMEEGYDALIMGSGMKAEEKTDLLDRLVAALRPNGFALLGSGISPMLNTTKKSFLEQLRKGDPERVITSSDYSDQKNYDIGSETLKKFLAKLDTLKAGQRVVVNGTMGYMEEKSGNYQAGTKAINEKLIELARRGVKIILVGGDANSTANKYGLDKEMNVITFTGGGVSLSILANETLVGLRALDRRQKQLKIIESLPAGTTAKFNIAINGARGRMGLLYLHNLLYSEDYSDMRVVALNGVPLKDLDDFVSKLTSPDSTYGKLFPGITVDVIERNEKKDYAVIQINGQKMLVLNDRKGAIRWDVVGETLGEGYLMRLGIIETSGQNLESDKAMKTHIASAEDAIVMFGAPPKDDGTPIVVLSVNEASLKADAQAFSNASCTTNCIAPVAKVLHDAFGVLRAFLFTEHAETSDQTAYETFRGDEPARARPGHRIQSPAKTGAAKLLGKLIAGIGPNDGKAMRVGTLTGSVVVYTAELERPATVKEIQNLFIQAAKDNPLIFGTGHNLSSKNIIKDPHSTVVDLDSIQVSPDGKTVKIATWYDNEYGYDRRGLDTLRRALISQERGERIEDFASPSAKAKETKEVKTTPSSELEDITSEGALPIFTPVSKSATGKEIGLFLTGIEEKHPSRNGQIILRMLLGDQRFNIKGIVVNGITDDNFDAGMKAFAQSIIYSADLGNLVGTKITPVLTDSGEKWLIVEAGGVKRKIMVIPNLPENLESGVKVLDVTKIKYSYAEMINKISDSLKPLDAKLLSAIISMSTRPGEGELLDSGKSTSIPANILPVKIAELDQVGMLYQAYQVPVNSGSYLIATLSLKGIVEKDELNKLIKTIPGIDVEDNTSNHFAAHNTKIIYDKAQALLIPDKKADVTIASLFFLVNEELNATNKALEEIAASSAMTPGDFMNNVEQAALTALRKISQISTAVGYSNALNYDEMDKLFKDLNVGKSLVYPAYDAKTLVSDYTLGKLPELLAKVDQVYNYLLQAQKKYSIFSDLIIDLEISIKQGIKVNSAVKEAILKSEIGTDLTASSAMEASKTLRTPIVGGNWKMSATQLDTEAKSVQLLRDTVAEIKAKGVKGVETIVAPTDLHISAVSKALKAMVDAGEIEEGAIQLAAQNISADDSGAQTGRTSIVNLKEYYGVKYVIIGHSEQRRDKNGAIRESSETINQKIKLALKHGFKVILCVGETLPEKESRETSWVVGGQVRSSLAGVSAEDAIESVTIAYEPVWAIGTGQTATPEYAQRIHSYIRNEVLSSFSMYGISAANKIRIQYGGSVTADNAAELIAQPDIDGFLVGGASLKADKFSSIVKDASASSALDASFTEPRLSFNSVSAVKTALKGIVEVTDSGAKVIDEPALRGALIDNLVYDSTFNPDQEIVNTTRQLIKDIAASLGVKPFTTYDKYLEKAKDTRHYTWPAINVRGMAYDTARAVFNSAVRKNVSTFILEIAKSEIGYTHQRPAEFTTSMLAAAIKEGYRNIIYLKGDHFQVALKDYQKDPVESVKIMKALTREAIEAGFYQIDLDMSPLVDWTKTIPDEQQNLNYKLTADFTRFVRDLERELGLDKKGIVVNLAGEIGEIGMGLDKAQQQNSTQEDLDAFMDGYLPELKALSLGAGYELKPITIIAVQTGTKHGGTRDAQGKLVVAKVGFNTLGALGKRARHKYGLAGVVQHGASTLPDPYFTIFAGDPVPEGTQIDETLLNEQGKKDLDDNPVAEVHLATAFQDTAMDHPELPADLGQEIKDHVLSLDSTKKQLEKGDEVGKALTDNRKNAWGPFKLYLWNLPETIKASIRASLSKQIDTMFENLGVASSAIEVNWDKVEKHIKKIHMEEAYGNEALQKIIKGKGFNSEELKIINKVITIEQAQGENQVIITDLKKFRKLQRQSGSQSSSTIDSSTSELPTPNSVEKLGAIDFRSMPMAIQPMGNFKGLNFQLPQLSQAELSSIDIPAEVQKVKNMVQSGTTPSGEWIKKLVAACKQKKQGSYINELFICLLDGFKVEEENALESSPDSREALVIVDSIS